ncbi:MAG TPA: DUF116 domain-containing protein [Thermoanaerobacterales bacterium]|nr:DUF116 domain-containing protein [Thermoanaerobacterales bacterium]
MRAKKRLFIGLLTVSLVFFLLTIGIMIYSYYSGLYSVYKYVILFIVIISLVVIIVSALGVLGMVLTIMNIKTYGPIQKLMIFAVKILYPMAITLGKVFGIPSDKIRSSFVEVNNHLVLTSGLKVKPERLLVLVPHCIQKDFCAQKITIDPLRCKRCGRCNIGSLIDLAEKYAVNIAVVPGGTLARRAVIKYKPHAIVAIACERDLTSGIQDTRPIPVLGVLNERPEGPCHNCIVDVSDVEKAIRFFIVEGEMV